MATSIVAPPNTSYKNQYDVFLNHSGPDVKKTLASHLYCRLDSQGFKVFLDKEEMQAGENLSCQIKGDIVTASVHVAIFSQTYAQSVWCLDELVLVLKSRVPILPVFYHVDSANLRRTSDKDRVRVYAEALRIHEKKRRHDPKIIKEWRKELSHVSNESGFELKECNGDEGVLLDRVVQWVEEKVTKTPLDLDSSKKTVLLQQQHRGKTTVVGIVGFGGVGKTTLAMEFFNRNKSCYDRSCFLPDVRDATNSRSLPSLQTKLIKDLTSRDLKIDSIPDGRGKLSITCIFPPGKDILVAGSLIVITSRKKDVLAISDIGESSIYELEGLNREHSQELFCLHAFHKRLPDVRFEEVVDDVLNKSDGLPLSLRVLGALLYGRDLKYWKAQLRKISKILPLGIEERLKISYDSLDVEEKEIFLDIACFFTKEDRDVAIRIWDASGWEGSLGLQSLEDKCLVVIDNKNRITMHDHLRDLGRSLAEKEPLPPRCWRRLWCPTDSLSDNAFRQTSATTWVRGINMVKQSSDQYLENPVELGSRFVGMSGLQLLRAEGNCLGSICNFLRQSNLLWLRWDRFPYSFLPSSIPMNNLIVLQLAGGKLETLWQRENEAPLQLRELHIDADLLQIPKSIGQLKHLEKIELKYTIETLPEELFHLRSLKHLSLSTRMTRLPNSLANLANLQYIDLSGCTNLQRLPSFGNLTELQHIHLNDCKMLQMLPVSFGNLIQLKNLSLSGCLNLTISSETLGDISTLESLDLSQCKKMEVLPPQVTHQPSLKILKLQCPLLEKLPASLGNLTSLQELTLNFCENLKSLPEMVRELKQLTTLIIANARIKHLPVGVRELNNLEHLSVSYCPLTEVPFHNVLADPREHRMLDSSIDKCMYMVRLKDLDMHGTRIKELAFPEGFCPNLQRLNVSFCNELEEVGSLPTTLLSLDLQDCSALKEIRGLSGLAKLQLLDISRCKKLKEMPGVETLASLEDLRGLTECKKLKNSIKKSVQDIIDTNRKRKS